MAWGRDPLRGAVCALGDRHRKTAELYSKATGRPAIGVSSVQQLARVRSPSVLVASWSQLHIEDLDYIYRLSVARAPIGIIVGHSPGEVRRRATICANLVARARKPPYFNSAPARAILGVPANDANLGCFHSVGVEDSDGELTRRILRGPSSILGVVGHCDGTDARVSETMTLCPRIDPPNSSLHQPQANCDVTGYCHRRRSSRGAALSSGYLVGPGEISAQVLLMLGCYLVRASGCSVHPAQGLLNKLLQNFHIGAIVAPWESSYARTEELAQLAVPLLNGSTIAASLANFYRIAQGALSGCNRYLLFGDPDFRPVARGGVVRLAPPASPAVLVRGLRAKADAKTSAIVRWVGSRLDRASLEIHKGRPTGVSQQVLREARTALVAVSRHDFSLQPFKILLSTMVRFRCDAHRHWVEEAEQLPRSITEMQTTCRACSRPGRLFHLETRFGTRWIASCARCALFYANVPAGDATLATTFEVDRALRVSLDIETPPHAAIVLHLRSSVGEHVTWSLDDAPPLHKLRPGSSHVWAHILGMHEYFAFATVVDIRG
jgi:hypothetical protein